MATAPVKSQPLHNFSLPFLKWGHKTHINNNHRYSEPESESDSDNRNLPAGSRTTRNRFSFTSCSSKKKQTVVLERESNQKEESAAKPWSLRPRKAVAIEIGEAAVAAKSGDLQGTSVEVKGIAVVQQNENLPKSLRLRGLTEGQGGERKEKRKFWIALSREEIEEDVYALTGSKPARRPKKRPRTVQKQLDNVFPGLYLVGITADSYRAYDALV